MAMNRIYFGDNLPILRGLQSESVDLIYIDPPFNTGKTQALNSIKTIKNGNGDRKGFMGNVYQTVELGTKSYDDSFSGKVEGILSPELEGAYRVLAPYGSLYFIEVFLRPRLLEAYRILKPHGSLYFHIDYREVHYCKILLDDIFGRDSFINEIIWAYDFGGKAKTKWPAKHDNILFYAKDPTNYIFNSAAIDRESYMAPGLVGPEKAERGKLPTDTWWHTIVGTNSKERTGYPTQKPLGVINRIIQASSYPGNVVLDFFAGSGSVGESCLRLEREFILIDNNPIALEVIASRFTGVKDIEWVDFDPTNFQKNVVELKTGPNVTANTDFDFLTSAAKYFRSEFENISDQWIDSPFEWMVRLLPAKKGSLAKKIIASWCATKGFDIEHIKDKEADLLINGHRCVIKFSFLWETGYYKFQQIRNQNYEYLICLGISPSEAHCWVIKKNYALQHSTSQHGGAKGSGTNWFQVNPQRPDEWLALYGGTFNEAYKVMKSLTLVSAN
jgi:site-specific DNA-methyltransferase (adenine-specific)